MSQHGEAFVIRGVVERFYQCLNRRDLPGMLAWISVSVASYAQVRLPASLPGGGVHDRLGFEASMCRMIEEPASFVEPGQIVVQEVVVGPGQVVAELAFPWRVPDGDPVSTGAVAWFRFRGDTIVDISVTYRDTALLVERCRQAREAARPCSRSEREAS